MSAKITGLHSLDQRIKKKKNSLFFPIQSILSKKKKTYHIFGEREEENKGNEPCGGLRLERDGTEREDK